MPTDQQNYPVKGSPRQMRGLQAALALAKLCEFDCQHTFQVTRLALILFDELADLHRLGDEQRYWLEMAALLHDIGWVEGWRGHHKTAQRIILNTQLLPLNHKERLIISCIARYHRQALPSKAHDHFSALNQIEQHTVSLLSGMLRLADGLDNSHQSRVQDLHCSIRGKKITVKCTVKANPTEEEQGFFEKCDLLGMNYSRKIEIKWRLNASTEAELVSRTDRSHNK